MPWPSVTASDGKTASDAIGFVYTPKHNGKVERYNRILAEGFLYARTWTSEDQREKALETWNLHYNYHRPHGVHDGKPPASATPSRVNNVLASYS